MKRWPIASRLLRFMRPLAWVMAGSVAARVGKSLAEIALPAVGVWGLASLVTGEGTTTAKVVMILVVLGGVKGLLRYVEQFSGHYVAFRLLAMLRKEFYHRIVPLAPAILGTSRSGDLISRVMSDVDRIEPFFAHTIAPVLAAILVPLITLAGLAAFVDPLFAWVLLPFVILTGGVVPVAIYRFGTSRVDRMRRTAGEVSAHLTEDVQGVREIVAFSAQQERMDELDRLGDRSTKDQRRLGLVGGFRTGLNELLVGLALLAVLATAIGLFGDGAIDMADAGIAVAVTFGLFPVVRSIEDVWTDMDTSVAAAGRVYEIIDAAPAVAPGPDAGQRPADSTLRFEHVTFGYSDESILRDVTLDIPAGSTVALVGPSGSGKTSLVNLAMRFWDPEGGRVVLGGVDLRDLPESAVRDEISMVSQRTHLFNASIRENVLLGRPDASQKEIEAACVKAAIHGFVSSLPDKYDTAIGEEGVRLSGGQRQRIAIARALLHDAPLLILDEATSELDRHTESSVQRALSGLMEGRTALVIAHRLAAVVDADQIAVLDGGRVIEQGTHHELLDLGGTYARLYAREIDVVSPLLGR